MKKSNPRHSVFRIFLYVMAAVIYGFCLWNFSINSPYSIVIFAIALLASIIMGMMVISVGKGYIELSDAIAAFLALAVGIEAAVVVAGANSFINGIINERFIVYKKDKSKKYFNSAMFAIVTYLASLASRWLKDYIAGSENFSGIITYSFIYIGLFLIINIIIVKLDYYLEMGEKLDLSGDSIKLLTTNFVVSTMLTTAMFIINESAEELGTVLVLGILIILHYCFHIYRKLQVRNEAIKGLLDITSNIVKYGDFRDKCKHLIISLKELIPYNLCAVYTFDIENDGVTYPIAYNGPEHIDIGELSVNLSDESLTARTIREGKTYISREIKKDKKIKVVGKLAEVSTAMMFVPILIGNNVVGLIILGGEQELVDFANNGVDDILNILSNQMALAIDNDSFYRNIKNKADRDPLTKLFNRRVFDREMDSLLETNTGFSLVMYDIDDFKVINDTYGHLFGDKVLRMVADVIMKSVRKTDVPCRYGGEEIAIIFKDLSKEDTLIISERIREKIETTAVEIGDKKVYVTISGGVSSFPDDGDTKEQVIEAADGILYSECKAKGKNRVRAFSRLPKPSNNTEQIQIKL